MSTKIDSNSLIKLAEIPPDTELQADVCIVGSGPAGGILAVELSKAGRSVILLEAGGEKAARDGDTLESVDVICEADLGLGRAFLLGGSSNLWAGRVAPLDPVDFDHREWVDEITWPLSHESLLPYYRRSLNMIGIAETALDADRSGGNARFEKAFSEGLLAPKPFVWSDPPFNIANYIAEEFPACAGRLRILVDAPVDQLESDSSGHVKAALLKGPGKICHRVEADQFVIAAGGLETPRLLLNSTDTHPAGLGNAHDLVGRYLSTHPKANVAVLRLCRPSSPRNPLFSDHHVGDSLTRIGVALSRKFQTQRNLLNHYVQFSPFSELQASRAFEMVKKREAFSSNFIDRSQISQRFLSGLGLWAFNRIGRVARLQPLARTLMVRAFLDQYPDFDNRVSLSQATDARGMRKLDIFWRFSKRDRQSVLDFLEILGRECRRSGIGNLNYDGLKGLEEWPLTAIHSHYLGTTRMSDDPTHGVVDPDCRVFGSPNLYVAGPSVFTTYGNANPFLTISALSMRLAEHMLVSKPKSI